MSNIKKLIEDGKFISHVWPGGYPMIYLDQDNCTLCADCATEHHNNDFDFDTIEDAGAYYEGPSMQCEGYNVTIESAYGEPK